MQRILLLWALLAACTLSFGQLDNRVFEDRMKMDEADSSKLFLGINLLGFGKDNEYDYSTDPVITGYTLFGYQLNPYLSYHITRNIRVDAGVYLQKDFGNSKYSTISPTLSVKYRHRNFSLIFGNLEGSLNHRLIEPLYDFERVLNNRLENGLQAQIIRDDLFFDAWVDWRKMIYPNDPGQEQFTTGLNVSKRIFTLGRTQLFLPIQGVINHHGGQINFSYSGPIQTLFNSAVGLEVRHPSTGVIRETRLNGFYVYYKTLTNPLIQPFKDGSGAYFNATLSTKYGLDIMGSYWQGHEFVTIEGGKIYPSVSVDNYTHQQHVMKLVILRLLYNIQIMDGLTATARLEPNYDIPVHNFQYSYGIYLNFRDRFFLWKRKKQ